MGKSEIINALSEMSPSELAEIQAKIDELTGETWSDPDGLSEAEIDALEVGLAEFRKNPGSGVPWDVARGEILSKRRS